MITAIRAYSEDCFREYGFSVPPSGWGADCQKQFAAAIASGKCGPFSTERTASPFPVEVFASRSMVIHGIKAGERQYTRAKSQGFKNNHGALSDSAILDIEGCVAQFIACHVLKFDLAKAFDIESFKGSDVAGYNVEVRSNYFPDGKGTLIGHWDDDPGRINVFITGTLAVASDQEFYHRKVSSLQNPEFFQDFFFAGWCWGWEVLQEPWKTKKQRQAREKDADFYFQLPQGMLHDPRLIIGGGKLSSNRVMPFPEAPAKSAGPKSKSEIVSKTTEELCITIPCKPAKPYTESDFRPIHVFIGNDSIGAAITRWQCPHCKDLLASRKACEKHMGMIMNIPAGCSVLKAQDEARRAALRKYLEETREEEIKHGNTKATNGQSAMGRSDSHTESENKERLDIHAGRAGSLFAGNDSVLDSQEHRDGAGREIAGSSRQSDSDASISEPQESRLSDELWMLREQSKVNEQGS